MSNVYAPLGRRRIIRTRGEKKGRRLQSCAKGPFRRGRKTGLSSEAVNLGKGGGKGWRKGENGAGLGEGGWALFCKKPQGRVNSREGGRSPLGETDFSKSKIFPGVYGMLSTASSLNTTFGKQTQRKRSEEGVGGRP